MIKITGLDEFTKKLDDLQKGLDDLEATKSVPLNEVLSPSFISRHTKFANLDEMLKAGGFKADSQEDLEAIPDDKLDEHVRAVSPFDGWQAMINEAGKEWATKKLGF